MSKSKDTTVDSLIAELAVKPSAKKTSKKNQSTAWYKTVANTIWDSKLIKWLAQGVVIACVAYTVLDRLTSLTAVQQLQGAVALVSTYIVINRAFKK